MDSHEPFSLPEKTEKTKLATLFTLKSKQHWPKRTLSVAFDSRHSLVEGFDVNSAYWLVFEKDGRAGGHYHNKKAEIFYVPKGTIEVELEDVKNKEKETIVLEAKKNHALYIPTGVKHSVVSKENGSILIVLATSPGTEDDTFRNF